MTNGMGVPGVYTVPRVADIIIIYTLVSLRIYRWMEYILTGFGHSSTCPLYANMLVMFQ